jgi:predicted glycoside hydrolase/deacetylase ChbG (UPF0249 family)
MNLNLYTFKLIINADDLGLCKQRDEGIFELFEKGCISSASVLVNVTNYLNAINKAKEIKLPLGLHLNLTEGEPVYKTNIKDNTLVHFDKESNKYLMHGKFKFREKLQSNQINMQDIDNEIIHQILAFIESYNNLPSHIDGHQHVHVIPQIAEKLAFIITNFFGIYHVRLPIENYYLIERNVQNSVSREFYKTVIKNSKESRKIFDNYNIIYPDYFIGMSLMGSNSKLENIQLAFKNLCIERKDVTVEYMCHPGNAPKEFYWDEFNSSDDRLLEKENLKLLNNIQIEKISFNDLKLKNEEKFRILILGDFTFGTGNSITAIRLQNIFKKLKFSVFLYNIKFINNSPETEIENIKNLEKFIINKKINFIVGIHLWRSGKIINRLRNENKYLKIPYILIVAGTDANSFIDNPSNLIEIKKAIKDSEKIISFNEEMKIKLETKLGDINCALISQSVTLEKNSSDFSIRKKLGIPDNSKITLFPSGIRQIKDPKFIINELFDLLEERQDHYVILIGAILEKSLYDELLEITKKRDQKRFIIHDPVAQSDFINILKESQLVINSSISEGMSNVLMESMKLSVPVLVRAIEGNLKLVENMKTGLVFDNPTSFKRQYNLVYDHEELRAKLASNAKIFIDDHFNIEIETEKYGQIVNTCFESYYKKLKLEQTFYLLFLKNLHPFSDENNELFKSAKVEYIEGKINILDVGCGSGIFSFIFLMNNRHLKVKELVLLDIDNNSLSSSYMNFLYHKSYFDIDKITLIKSDILSNLDDKYTNSFDIVMANMPQTPSKIPIRSILIFDFR